ncbi:hypothetical protein TSUD_403510, partial [Trifolium subterraneum]
KNAALLDALCETIQTVNEQNNRIRALEDGQRQILGYIKPPSPPRRAERSESPPARRAGTSQRRPVLERVQPQVQKRNRTPPREDSVARTNKRGKAAALFEQRPRSPPRRKEILLGGMAQGSRGDDYQSRREDSPRREETPTHSPGWSDDEVYKGPLSRQIMGLKLPRALQKSPQLGKYDGLTDPDIHIQNIDVILNYQAVRGGIKCRIFPTTLVEGAMAWYRSLPQGSITSWKDLCKQFTSHFTASRKHPKTEANLEAKYLMRKNLRDGTKFKEMVAIEKPATWDEILYKAQAYMQFEEETMADAMRYSRTEDNRPPREHGNRNGDKRNGDRRGRDKSREPRGPPSQFTNYTPLLVPREIVLAECAASDFKNDEIRFPKSTPFKPGQDRSRYCAYHKSYGHLTEDCIQLKDAIEILIRNGKLKDYIKRKENPRQEKKQEDTPEDEPRASGEKNVALAVWRPEDFYVPKHLKDTYENLKIGKDVPDLARKQLVACLKDNADMFSWSASEMPGLDPNIACHQLTVDEAASSVVQRRRRQSPEKMEAAEKAVKDLLEANFISEAKYTTWLSNVVLVKKSNGKWRMCVDYTDLNRACPKYAYPLPCIDRLVDNSSGFKLLSFLDAYSGYNQIPMAVADRTKTAFMTESGNYYYNDMLEVYMDDMIVKSHDEVDHTVHLQKVFEQTRKVNMRFNPEKCTFGIRAGKFLGFYLTERGIEANPDKCRAFTEFPTPNDKKSIQTLNGMLIALSRFVAKSVQHALPLFKLLRKESAFEWTEECEQTLQHLKKALSEPPVLLRPDVGEVLYLYLAVASEAVSATLIRETLEGQKPVYFTSKALQGPELRYQRIGKVALALVIAARRLRYYFLAHTIVVRTDQPIKSLLVRPDMAGRMLKWSLELSEFDIRYESRNALKAQVLADFVAEMTCSFSSTDGVNKWTIFVDGASNATGAGAGIIIENEDGILIEVSLALSFPTSNNQAEYEAFLAGLRLAEDVGAKEIKIYTDSQLVASQVLGEYQAKNDNLSEYLALVKERITKFDSAEIQHKILSHPSIQKPTRVLDINAIGDANCWMTPVYNYLAHGTLPNDEKEAATCADEATADYILREIHEGINSHHLGEQWLGGLLFRTGPRNWPKFTPARMTGQAQQGLVPARQTSTPQALNVLLDMNPLSSSTPPRIMEPLHQDNSWQQLLLLFRSYLGSSPYWAAQHSPLRGPLAQRWGQLYKLSLTGEQGIGAPAGTTPPSVVELLLDAV